MHEMEQLRKESMTALRLEALERERAAVRRVRDEADAALAAEREASEEAMQALGQEEEDRVRRKVKEAQRAWERQRAQLEGQVRAGLQQLAAQEKQVLPPAPTLPRTKWTRRVPHPVLIGHATCLVQVCPPAGLGHRCKARFCALTQMASVHESLDRWAALHE